MAARHSGLLGAATPLVTFVVLGVPAGALGVAWPPMRASFGAPLAGLGFVLAGITIAYFVGSASYGRLSERLSGTSLLIAGCGLAGLGMVGFSIAFQWWLVPTFGLFVGGGSGLIDAALNTQVSLNRGIRYMGWLHASWAAGAALAPPLVIASLGLTGSWRGAFAAAGVGFLACGALASYQRHQLAPVRQTTRGGVTERTSGSSRRGLAAASLAGLFLLGAGLEATTGDWSYTQLTLGREVPSSIAGVGASLFWAGLAGGRVALGLLGHRAHPLRLLDLSIAACVFSSLLFWLAPAAVANFVALPLIGLAVSLIFPLLLSMTPGRVGADLTGHTVGYGLAAGTLGGGAIPAVSGLPLQGIGLWTLGPILSGLAVGLLLVHGTNRQAGV